MSFQTKVKIKVTKYIFQNFIIVNEKTLATLFLHFNYPKKIHNNILTYSWILW